jgi:hypothetical protein
MIPKNTRENICRRYQKLAKILLVAKEFNINEKTVRNILKEYGVKTTPREFRNKKYSIDPLFFRDMNKEKAYMLGFIYGDGSVNDNSLSIEISTKDEYILDVFRSMLGDNPPPIYRRVRKRKGTITKSSSLVLCGHDLVKNLADVGLMKNKSAKIKYPNIKHHRDFIRGLSDSDGCIRIDKNNRALWSLISSHSICNSVCNILSNIGVLSCVKRTRYKGLSRVLITRKSEIIKLRDYLYDGDCPCLERKRVIFFDVHYRIHSKYAFANAKGGEG